MDVWPGLAVGETSHDGRGLGPTRERVFDHGLARNEARFPNAITTLQDDHGRLLVIVDQPNTIENLPIADGG